VIRDKDLRERHLGDLQGHVYQDLVKLSPKAYEAFKSRRSDQEVPGGGESRDQLYNRCTSLVQKIGENHRGYPPLLYTWQRVIVVSHGGAIRSLFNRAAAKGQHPGKISNTSVYSLYLVSVESVKNGDIAGEAGLVDGSCTEIIVVRHGETEWNALSKMQGQTDFDLNEAGRQQTIKVVTDTDLRERHIGDLQGLTYSEAPKVNPIAFEALKSPRKDQEIPGGGESKDQVFRRCTTSLERIAEKHRGERVVVVTHGGIIEKLYKRAVPGERPGGVWNTSISIFQLSEGEISGQSIYGMIRVISEKQNIWNRLQVEAMLQAS
uniref:Phosphoglycerate mutase n=1 Tax=Chenopodium quinoa TaxID=63459 RepID=A0A803MDH1_CHEQI